MMESAVIIAVIVGLVQIIKTAGLPSQYASIVSVVLGVCGAFLVANESTLGLTVFNGIIYGLSASGLYSGGRSTLRI